MDSVNEAEEAGDVGVCMEHSRVFQCYCNQCFWYFFIYGSLICPSCLMFGEHKGHDVSPIQQGSKDIRKAINQSAKEGILKFDRTENVLLDIRHVKLSLEESQQKIIAEAENSFDELISIIKGIREQFNAQLQKVQDTEAQWVRKQQLSQKILKLQTSKDNMKLLEQGRQIIEGLKNLAIPLQYKQIKLIESLKRESLQNKNSITENEIKDILKAFMFVCSPTLYKLKC